jgi:hypothetical protein
MKRRPFLVIVFLLLVVTLLAACDQPGATPTPRPGAILLSYARTGGIAGFQDQLAVALGGEYFLSRGGQAQRLGTLSAERRGQLLAWSGRFAPFTLTLEDNPGGPDNMTRQVVWTGTGRTAPGEATQRQVLDWAGAVFDELNASPR